MTDTYTLIRKAQTGIKYAEDRLVAENIALVHSCARRLMRDGFEYEDLVQIGSIGLVKAIRRFDTLYNVRFSTYAVPIITGDIKRYIRDNSMVKVSRSLKEIFLKITKLRQSLSCELMREPTVNELAEKSGYSVEKLIMALEACAPCDSLERNVFTDGSNDLCLADVIKSQDDMNTEIDKMALKNAIGNLKERERKIILLRYFRGKTQSEVSAIIGVSQVQISRIEKKVLGILKEKLE